jgi:hypothetical protein
MAAKSIDMVLQNIDTICNKVGYRYRTMAGLMLEDTKQWTSAAGKDVRSAADYCYANRHLYSPNALVIESRWNYATWTLSTWTYTCKDVTGSFKGSKGSFNDAFLTSGIVQGRMCGTSGENYL